MTPPKPSRTACSGWWPTWPSANLCSSPSTTPTGPTRRLRGCSPISWPGWKACPSWCWRRHVLIRPGRRRRRSFKFFKDELYLTVSEKLTIYRIPVLADGGAGPATVYAEGIGGDNIAFDQKGNLYVTTDPFNTVVVVRPDGTQRTIASAEDGLDGPSAVAFGTRSGEEDVLYITNLAIFSAVKRPSLMRMHIGIPGKPLP